MPSKWEALLLNIADQKACVQCYYWYIAPYLDPVSQMQLWMVSKTCNCDAEPLLRSQSDPDQWAGWPLECSGRVSSIRILRWQKTSIVSCVLSLVWMVWLCHSIYLESLAYVNLKVYSFQDHFLSFQLKAPCGRFESTCDMFLFLQLPARFNHAVFVVRSFVSAT